eukprot:tig00020553_g10564.t1
MSFVAAGPFVTRAAHSSTPAFRLGSAGTAGAAVGLHVHAARGEQHRQRSREAGSEFSAVGSRSFVASRRLLLSLGLLAAGQVGLAGMARASASGDDAMKQLDAMIEKEPRNARLRFIRGGERFRRALIDESIEDFDVGVEEEPERLPYAWQRGISYYYADRFEEGIKQFEVDMRVNGSDVEETVWRFLCMARLGADAEKAEKEIIKIKGDPRPVMSQVYAMFSTGKPTPEELVASARDTKTKFYANLYAGLYCEALGRAEEARRYILAAAAFTEMARDYMWDVARVHAIVRGWA